MLEIKQALDKVEKSKSFSEWKKDNRNSYLSHVFLLTGGENAWQIGYYNKDTDKVTTFEFSGAESDIKVVPDAEVFKKETMRVLELDPEKVKISLENAIETAETLQKGKYMAEVPIKKIIILQNLETHGLVYNITYVTQTFKTLNIKINAADGSIVDEQLISIIQSPQKK